MIHPDDLRFVSADQSYFEEICFLVSSPEELFLVHPSGQYPWNTSQLKQLEKTRKDLTVALYKEQVAAFANLYDVQARKSAFIGNVIVGDAFKGKGIGKALIKHMMEVCKQQYQATPHISVFSFNTKALSLYQALGFEEYDSEIRKSLTGRDAELIHMKK